MLRRGARCAIFMVLAAGSTGIAQTAKPVTGPPDTVTINVDLDKTVGEYVPLYRWFGYDEANYSTTTQGRALLGELHALSPVPVYIRAHHLLTSGDGVPQLKWSSTNVYSEDAAGKPVYDFKLLDGIFDAYKAAGVRPMVELGFMPKDLAARLPEIPDQPYEVLYPNDTLAGASQNPPKDYAKWEELVRVVTTHLVQRYGRDEVLQWYFEVWNEPNIAYFHGSEQEYLKLYDYAVAGVRAALPGARVGGPATTSPRDAKAYTYLQLFLEHVAKDKSAATGQSVPLDFISFHAKGQPSFTDGGVTMGIDHELTDVDRGFQLIASMPKFRRLPIILSEADPEGCAACSSKINPANSYRNGTLYPTYTAAVYKRLFDLADSRGVNLVGMLSWSFEFEGKDTFDGFRSLSTNGIDKPVLNVFRMFGLMGGTRVATTSTGEVPMATMLSTGVRDAPDVASLATRDGQEASVLLWDYHDAAADGQPATVTVHVTGLPQTIHRALLVQYRIDGTHSNAYAAWLALGSPQKPSPAQMTQLKEAGGLQLLGSPAWVDVNAGRVAIETHMPRESVGLLRLIW